MSRSFKLAAALVASVVVLSAPAAAQSYPTQPIRIIVPTPPGGVADLLARAVAQGISANTGKTVIAEQRTGAGGAIAADFVAKSAPDGYTIFMGFHPTQSILQHLQKLPYDPAKDFEPIILVGASPNMLVVHPSLPAKTPRELVEHARKNPGKISFGSPGNGSSGHMVGEQFKIMHKLDLVHVPYKGAGPAVIDLVAGHIQMMFDIVPLAREQLLAGKVRALGVMSPKRLPVVPDVPTMAEQGMPELEGGPWFGLLAPAKTPRPIIDWLNAETRKAMAAPEIRAKLEALGVNLPLGTPEEFGKHIAAETVRWGDIIRRAGIKL
ncbi:MAG: tripartite tricarboxylate transporter substrate binding protein [Hyphomicrobiales bacterium]|nr:tripartite tricarboxylate transporter substrate binding protein [Hyphomicrobiales bacterium]